jgi:two-component system chemotaxis response regulator CheY
VLLVDDEPIVRRVAEVILVHLGFRVVTASGGLEALDRLRTLAPPPVLVLCDVDMPDGDGLQLLLAAKADPALRAIPFLMVSGIEASGVIRTAATSGASGWIQKPFDPSSLERAVLEVLGAAVSRANGGEPPRRSDRP